MVSIAKNLINTFHLKNINFPLFEFVLFQSMSETHICILFPQLHESDNHYQQNAYKKQREISRRLKKCEQSDNFFPFKKWNIDLNQL